jgi:hypothetical protein
MHDRLYPHRAFSRIGLVNWLETPGLGPAAPFSDQVGPRPQATPLWHVGLPSPASMNPCPWSCIKWLTAQ